MRARKCQGDNDAKVERPTRFSAQIKPRTRMRLLPFRASRKTIKSICSNEGGEMKILTSLLAAALLFADVGTGHAAVRIAGDRGGRIGNYISKFQRLHSSGEPVVIDGLCASACTLVLAAVPHDKICVTSRASLGFHAAYDFGDQWPYRHQSGSDRDVVCELSDARSAMDRRSGRIDAPDNLPAREAATGDVSTVSFDASRVRWRVNREVSRGPRFGADERPTCDPCFTAGLQAARTDECREVFARSVIGAVMLDDARCGDAVPACTENPVRVDAVLESPKLSK